MQFTTNHKVFFKKVYLISLWVVIIYFELPCICSLASPSSDQEVVALVDVSLSKTLNPGFLPVAVSG